MGLKFDVLSILDAFDLAPLMDRAVNHLSVGQKRRLALTRLHMLHRPLWFLDEPSNALDQRSTEILKEHIECHREQGGIVVMAGHDDLRLIDVRTETLVHLSP